MLTSSKSSPLKADLRNSSLEERSDDMVLVVEGLTFDDQLKDSDKVSTPPVHPFYQRQRVSRVWSTEYQSPGM